MHSFGVCAQAKAPHTKILLTKTCIFLPMITINITTTIIVTITLTISITIAATITDTITVTCSPSGSRAGEGTPCYES